MKERQGSTNQDTKPSINTAKDSVASGRGLTCVPIPHPWTLQLLPNPTLGPITIRAKISYTDNQVSCELWDMKGKFVKILSQAQMREIGSFDIEADLTGFSSGVYLIVLKGSGSAVTERVMISK